jgi:transcription elongation factor GreA
VRPKIIQFIEESRALGDLKENAEYQVARDEQYQNESKIQHLESILSRAEIIDSDKIKKTHVAFGVKVKVEENDFIKTYHLVNEFESDVNLGKISIKSPFGKELLSKKISEDFEFVAPNGSTKNVKILEIY